MSSEIKCMDCPEQGAEFCIRCLRERGDRAETRAEELRTTVRVLVAELALHLRAPMDGAQ